MAEAAADKVVFANQLRGIAALCVVVSHYLGTYWGSRDYLAQHMHAPAPEGSQLALFSAISFPTLNYGPLGVGIFFLLSGFVIPFSLEKLGGVRFILSRAIRIFPTYWVGLSITLAMLWLSGAYWGQPFQLDFRQWWTNMLLVNLQFALPSLDEVNWTLAIEIRFYLAMLLLWPGVRRAPAVAVPAFALLMLGFLAAMPPSWDVVVVAGTPLALNLTKIELMFLPFLLVGTLFYFAFMGRVSTGKLLLSLAITVAAFSQMWRVTPWAAQYWSTTINYGYALLVFGAAYAMRRHFAPSRILDFLARISYSLYVVHAWCGYVTIRILMDRGWGTGVATLCAFGLAVAVAYAVHRLVEAPTAHFGKRLRHRNAAA